MTHSITYRDKFSHLAIAMNKRWIQLQKFGVPLSERLEVITFTTLFSVDDALLHQVFRTVEEKNKHGELKLKILAAQPNLNCGFAVHTSFSNAWA